MGRFIEDHAGVQGGGVYNFQRRQVQESGSGTEERSARSIGDAAGEGLLHGWIAIGKALRSDQEELRPEKVFFR